MSITDPNRGYSGQPPPPPPRRSSYPYVPESNPYSETPRYPPENNQYPTESNERRLPTLPPIRPRDEQQQYNPYNKPPPYPQDQHHSQPQYSSNHPLQLSQQNPTAPPQHIYQPPQPADYSRPTSYLAAEPHPIQTQDRVGSPVLEDHGAPPAQRRQSRKISQRKDFPGPKYSTDLSSAHPRVRYEEQRASSGGYTPPETASNERFSANPPPPVDTTQKSQQSRPMPISRLLSDDNGTNNRPVGPQYRIRVRQQPLAARACGFGERDRRVIDPPPILQLSIEDPNASPAEISELIRQPYSVVHCTLWNPLTDRDDTAMPGSSDKRQQRRLMGTLVASPFVGLDENDVEGCFFCFPDLSVRTAGTYSLKFSLVVLDPKKMMLGNSVPVRATVMSESFQVYNAKDFIGMRASTELTKRLKHQGCLISVKKGNAKTNASHARDEDDEDDDDDDEDGAQASSKQKAKRPKR